MSERAKLSWKTLWPSSDTIQNVRAILYALAIPLVYTLVTVLLFKDGSILENQTASDLLSTMACGFLLLVPVAMGALTVAFSPEQSRRSLPFAICQPWLSVIMSLLAVSLLQLEAIICLIMALPIFMLLASVGGILFHVKAKSVKTDMSALCILMLAPYVVTPLEMQTANPDTIYEVKNQIEIEADVDTVWQNIIEVPMIGPDEQRFSIFHLIGLPKPLEATLSHEGVGGVRHASFENDLIFIEELTTWRDHESLSFTINRDKQRMLNGALNEIGGQYFGIIDGTYRIEEVDDETVILHLSSRHRLSTRFDFYGSLWTKWVMWDLQQYILKVIEERCETEAAIGNHVHTTQAIYL